jgi:transcriptional regulator with XRE-family HTH domain
MNNQQKLLQIRNKKMGLLLLDARKAARRSIEESAEAMGVPPSLPQLELFALFLNLPIEHFWGKRALTTTDAAQPFQEKERLLILRSRVIGTNLRMARNSAGLSIQEMAEKTGIPEERINRYEMGEVTFPVTELELFTGLMEIPIERFYDEHGPIGKWRAQQGSLQKFLEMPPDVQQFVSKPVNRPYLELAMRLSEMSAEKLRAVAEVLLEITY